MLLLLLLPACGGEAPDRGGRGGGRWGSGEKREEYALPVRVAKPTRGDVDDYVDTQANLESDTAVTVLAEADAEVIEQYKDVGDRIGQAKDGDDPYLLARLDDRDLKLALRDAEIDLEEKLGRVRESELELKRNQRLVEQSNVELREAEAVHRRTSTGIQDGTLSREEHETATFALNRAKTAVLVAEAAVDKAVVSLELGKTAVKKAQVTRDRAKVALEKTEVRSPIAGTVTMCEVDKGQWVSKGMALFRVEDTKTLVVYAEIPVRQAARVKEGNPVLITSTATPGGTSGKVELVEPTVNRQSGTVRVKVRVKPAPRFKPGLFVSLRIVVESRTNALVVPKRAVMHHDEDGAYLFLVKENKAARVLVTTGFEKGGLIEISKGVGEADQVVIEGQDTLADGAKVEIKEG